jgi:predicted PurR-regulated permease PerM
MEAQKVFRNTLIVLGTILVAYILVSSIRVLIVLFLAITVASALRVWVVRLTHLRLPQGAAIVLVYSVLVISLILIGLLVIPPLIEQTTGYLLNEDRLANRVIFTIGWVERNIANLTGTEVVFLSPDDVQTAINDLVNQLRTSGPAVIGNLSGTVGDALLVFIMGVYWLTSRDKIADFIVELLALRNRERARQIISDIEVGVGGYVRGVVMVAVIVTVMMSAALYIFQVEKPLALGFVVGIMTMLPVVGTVIGGIAVTLFALLDSPVSGVIVFVIFFVVQQIETNILTPRMMSQRMGIDPLLVILSIFAGFALNGVIGGIIAVPVVGTIATLVRHLIIEPRRVQLEHKVESGGVLINTKAAKNEQAAKPSMIVGS